MTIVINLLAMEEKWYLLKADSTWTLDHMFRDSKCWSHSKIWNIAQKLVKAKDNECASVGTVKEPIEEIFSKLKKDEVEASSISAIKEDMGFNSSELCLPIQTPPVDERESDVNVDNLKADVTTITENCVDDHQSCSLTSDRIDELSEHTCNICQKEFSHRSYLQAHLKTHSVLKRYHCSYCNKEFSKKSMLNIHLRVHTGEGSFCCDHCNKKYTTKAGLTVHMLTHTGERPYSCDICDYSCKEKGSLTIHKRTHTGERPYSCDICHYSCTTKGYLTIHKRTHTGERPYSCDICDYSCTSKSVLTEHMRIHILGDKRYGCEVCGEKFHRQADWSKHIRCCWSKIKNCNQ